LPKGELNHEQSTQRILDLRAAAVEKILSAYGQRAAEVATEMARIAVEGKSEFARITAGREVTNALLPGRQPGPIVQINNSPRLVSHLGIPEVYALDGQIVKALPERDPGNEPLPEDTPPIEEPPAKGKPVKKRRRRRPKKPIDDPRPEYTAAGLGAREAAVIELRSRGMTLKEVANELGVALGSVYRYRNRAANKLKRIVYAAQTDAPKAQYVTKPPETREVKLLPLERLAAAAIPSLEQPKMPGPVMIYPDASE